MAGPASLTWPLYACHVGAAWLPFLGPPGVGGYAAHGCPPFPALLSGQPLAQYLPQGTSE